MKDEECNIHNCDIYHAISLVKSRYSSVVIFSLETEKTFTELKNEFSYITPTQLTRTLKPLIENGIIEKEEKYRLTIIGFELAKILHNLDTWYEDSFNQD